MKLRNRVSLRIRTIRKKRGLTQEQLAERIGRTADAVSQLERGVSLPSVETLERIAVALETPIQDFFDGTAATSGSALRTTYITQLLDAARRMSDKELGLALQVLEAVATYKVRPTGKS